MTTLRHALDAGARRLAAAGIETARLDARLLLCHAVPCPPEAIIGHGERPLATAAAARFDAALARRQAREPVALITGRREFWTLDLRVTSATLSPRPESETVVEAALNRVRDKQAPLRLLDLGTGTGCLLLALLTELPAARGLGIDRSAAVVATALRNAREHGVDGRADFVVGDWARAIRESFDVVVANPPYIPSGTIEALEPEVARHEPRAALDGGADGLDAYRAILPDLPRLARPGAVVALEVGAGQAAWVAGRLVDLAFEAVAVVPDLAGIGRVVLAQVPKAPKKSLGLAPDVR